MKLVFGDQLSPLVDLLEAFVEHSLSPKHLTAGGRFTESVALVRPEELNIFPRNHLS